MVLMGLFFVVCIAPAVEPLQPVRPPRARVDVDGDGWTRRAGDCWDRNPDVYPGAVERCNGLDDDCDFLFDTDDPDIVDAVFWYQDADHDGYGAVALGLACEPPTDGVVTAGDCDDGDAAVSPGMAEDCGGGDEDCDGLIDDADPDVTGLGIYYLDQDGDGYGDPYTPLYSCLEPSGAVDNAGDCNDLDAAIQPDSAEVCDAADTDEDCDGLTDDADPDVSGQGSWYLDEDGDGYGDVAVRACDYASEWASIAGDCDDSDAAISPGVAEICRSGVDEDCDGLGCPLTGTVALTGADARLLAARPYDQAGYVTTGAGDINDDGYDDITVGASFYSELGVFVRGAVFLVYGPVRGDVGLESAAARWMGEVDYDEAGTALANAGDVSGDGLPDVLIGAYKHDNGGSGRGAAYVLFGGTGSCTLDAADVRLVGTTDGDQIGYAVAGVGDMDADGLADLLVGAPNGDEGSPDAGTAWLVQGAPYSGDISSVGAAIVGERTGHHAGTAVAGIGDMNGDGYADMAVGAPYVYVVASNAGAAYVVEGPGGAMSLADATSRLYGVGAGDQMGITLSGGHDVDGDGAPELLVCGWGVSVGGRGRCYLVSAPAAGDQALSGATAAITGAAAADAAGFAASLVGDIDADGFGDVVIGARYQDTAATDAGAAYVLYGPVAGSFDLSAADATLLGEGADEQAGRSVGAAGDVDADGQADVLIGAYHEDTRGTSAGAVYLLYGSGL